MVWVRPEKIPLAPGPYGPEAPQSYRILKVVDFFGLDSNLLTGGIFWIFLTRSGSNCYSDNSGATI